MKKQEVIEKIEKLEGLTILDKAINFDSEMIPKNKTLSIVNQIDEPEKAVLSEAEAEWLEGLKEAHSGLSKTQLAYFITRQGWGYLFEYKEKFEGTKRVLNLELYPNKVYPKDLKERLLNAVLYGYEVEKEKLYTVELPNSNNLDYLMLQKDRRGKISVAWYCTDSWREDERVRLTEAEIKKDYDWAWQFAKEVEE